MTGLRQSRAVPVVAYGFRPRCARLATPDKVRKDCDARSIDRDLLTMSEKSSDKLLEHFRQAQMPATRAGNDDGRMLLESAYYVRSFRFSGGTYFGFSGGTLVGG